ncbi:3D domain-containing protein [Bacillus velezensis]|uniref:3D domain-containing protein n=1 Tax=Bacillus velezensis TaxID=492670 RepID=UPI00311A9B27
MKPTQKHVKHSTWQTFEASAYTAYCAEGCTGTTATGLDVSHTIYHAGKRIIAVDPSVIALGSTVEVRQADGTTFEAVSQDTGGAIKGAKIDVLVENEADAVQFGRQSVQVRVIK